MRERLGYISAIKGAAARGGTLAKAVQTKAVLVKAMLTKTMPTKAMLQAMLLLAALLTTGGCKNELADDPLKAEQPVAVAFDVYLGGQQTTRSGSTGEITNEILQRADFGFGVYAYYTGSKSFSNATGGEGFADFADGLYPNFMYNQQVKYNTTSKQWEYSPVKYWPNGEGEANDETGQGETQHKVSFFAYAPYVGLNITDPENVKDDPASDTSYGITAINGCDEESPIITYKLGIVTKSTDSSEEGAGASGDGVGTSSSATTTSTIDLDKQVDLLYATPYIDRTKQSVTDRLKFNFIHALSKLNFTVQGIFDHLTPSDNPHEGYSSQRAEDTRILIESVTIQKSGIPSEGKLYLSKPEGTTPGSSGSTSLTTPYWIPSGDGAEVTFDNSTASIKSDLLFTADPSDETDSEVALTAFLALNPGVTEKEEVLLANNGDTPRYLFFPPTNHLSEWTEYQNKTKTNAGPLKINVKYKVITYDPQLELNTPKYFSIVENDITASFPSDVTFEPNKQYTLRLLLGLTTLKFELLEFADTDTPILLAAVVKEWEVQTTEIDVTHN